jgi:hypothetical protein
LDDGGAPDFTRLYSKQYAWAGNQPHDLTRPPQTPIELFHTLTAHGPDTGDLVTWLAGGRVSSHVAKLFAALPTGEAAVVPFDPDTGAFVARIQLRLSPPLEASTAARSPLGLYAYDDAGALIFQTHGS